MLDPVALNIFCGYRGADLRFDVTTQRTHKRQVIPGPQHVINSTSRSGRVLAVYSTYIPKHVWHLGLEGTSLGLPPVLLGCYLPGKRRNVLF